MKPWFSGSLVLIGLGLVLSAAVWPLPRSVPAATKATVSPHIEVASSPVAKYGPQEATPTPTATPSAGLANSPWPMFRHDPQHTGRSPYDGPTVPALKWTYLTGDKVDSSPAIGADGVIYVASWDNKLYAINPNGSLRWSYTTGSNDFQFSSPALGADGTIYVGSDGHKLYALNPNGTLKWSYATGSIVQSSPAIGADGTVYVGSHDNKLYAINPNGSLKWSYTTGGVLESSPAIGVDGTVYVGSREGKKLYAINPNGSLKWSYTIGAVVNSSPAIEADGTVYVGAGDTKLYAISPNGSFKWSYQPTTGSAIASSPAIGADGTVYVGTSSGLYAIDPNGSLKWNYFTRGNIWYSSPAIGADGTVYVGDGNWKLYAINPDGTIKWSYLTGGPIWYSSPAIGGDGTIYVGSGDGKLHAIGQGVPPTPTPSPAPSPSPTPSETPAPTPSPTPTPTPTPSPSPTPILTPDKYDEFSTSAVGYNPAMWQAETAGAGEGGWDGVSVLGQASPGEGFAGLSSRSSFQYGTAEFRAKSADAYGALNQFGWTDAASSSSPAPYRYNFNAGGNNGVWLHDSTGGFYPSLLTFAAKSNGNLTQKTVTLDPPNDSKQSFHIYKIVWQAGAAELYVDGLKKATITTNVPSVSLPFKMVSEAWQGSSAGGWMYADYVKIWSASIVEPTPTPSPAPMASLTPTATPSLTPSPTPGPTVTPVPTPSPTTAPSPTPTPTPLAGTYVQAVSRDVSVAGTVQIPVMVKNFAASAGLGGYDFGIGYDPAVIRVLEVTGGPAPFNSIAASNINNATGQVVFNGYQVQNPGPKGNITVAYLSISAQGTIGASTALTVTVNSLVDADGAPIPATPVNGMTRIVSTQAVVALVPVAGSDGIARIDVRISRIINPRTGADVPAARGIGAFDGAVSFDKSGLSILEIKGYGAFAGSLITNIRNDTGTALFNGFQVGANPQAPVTLVQFTPKLGGSSAESYGLQVSFNTIADVVGAEVPQDAAKSLSLRRGNARADSVINIADALFIAQYLAGIRNAGADPASEINTVNAASVRPDAADTVFGDEVTITDALFIAQMLAGLRDASYNFVT